MSLRERVGANIARKLVNVLGQEAAEELVAEVLRELGSSSLTCARERLMFGESLVSRGGITTVLGRSIATQALLQGAVQQVDTLLSTKFH